MIFAFHSNSEARRMGCKMKANRKFLESEEAVSAVIGVILMVAITVAIAATVYVFVSGMLGGGPTSTPTVSLVAEPAGSGSTLTIGTPTASDIEWRYVWYSCSNITGQSEPTLTITWPSRATGQYVKGGQSIFVTAGLNGNPSLTCEYRFTLVYNTTGGSMGTVTWTQ